MDKIFVTLDAARQVICDACGRPGCPRLWGNDCDRIDRLIAISAADVRPVVRGEWLPAKDGYYGHVMCSACHKIESHETDFCPNCGADMRKPNLNTTKGDNHD